MMTDMMMTIRSTNELSSLTAHHRHLLVRALLLLLMTQLVVGGVRGQQRSVHRLHARWTKERTHKPGVDARHVIVVHARQASDLFTGTKVNHADAALAYATVLLSGGVTVPHTPRQVLDEPEPPRQPRLVLNTRWHHRDGGGGLLSSAPCLAEVTDVEGNSLVSVARN